MVLAACVGFGIAAAAGSSDRALDQISALALVFIGVDAFTAYTLFTAFRKRGEGVPVGVRRVRQVHRLTSRSWIEVQVPSGTYWVPVFFDPVLLSMPAPTVAVVAGPQVVWEGHRLYASGPVRHSEPVGRLVDSPSMPDVDAAAVGVEVGRPLRRLTLDAQQTVAAPLVGLLWVYIDGGGIAAFVGATCVAAAVAMWLAAIRGSDPS